jgi:hypothetical protein
VGAGLINRFCAHAPAVAVQAFRVALEVDVAFLASPAQKHFVVGVSAIPRAVRGQNELQRAPQLTRCLPQTTCSVTNCENQSPKTCSSTEWEKAEAKGQALEEPRSAQAKRLRRDSDRNETWLSFVSGELLLIMPSLSVAIAIMVKPPIPAC